MFQLDGYVSTGWLIWPLESVSKNRNISNIKSTLQKAKLHFDTKPYRVVKISLKILFLINTSQQLRRDIDTISVLCKQRDVTDSAD